MWGYADKWVRKKRESFVSLKRVWINWDLTETIYRKEFIDMGLKDYLRKKGKDMDDTLDYRVQYIAECYSTTWFNFILKNK